MEIEMTLRVDLEDMRVEDREQAAAEAMAIVVGLLSEARPYLLDVTPVRAAVVDLAEGEK
jgi:hypothetical protein